MTPSDQDEMELAGYADATGKLGKIVESSRLAPPKWVTIKRGRIQWIGGLEALVEPPVDILDQFLRLWDADDAEILAFAKKYGTLRPSLSLRGNRLEQSDWKGSEPLSRWRALSKHAQDLLKIAAVLRTGEKLSFEQWAELVSPDRSLAGGASGLLGLLGPRGERLNKVDWLSIVRFYLETEVREWNRTLGPVSFGIERDEEAETGWKTVLKFGGSMPCYIGLQLMLVIAGGDVFICSACHRPYIRPRGRNAPKGLRKAPKAGERNYCQSEDCIRERNRIASQRYRHPQLQRQRKRGKR
jgi:hypothetical protein